MSIYKKHLFDEKSFKKPVFDTENLPLSEFPIEDWENNGVSYDQTAVKDNDYFNDLVFGIDNAEIVNNYLKCDVTDGSGTLQAKMWSSNKINFNEVISDFENHKIYRVSGKWNEWPKGSGKFSIVIDRYVPVHDAKAEDLLPLIKESRVDLRNELLFYISTLSVDVQNLALDILKDVWEFFSIRPAAKGHHHFQLGGLLQHKVELMRIAHTYLDLDDYDKREKLLFYVYNLTNKALWNEKSKQRKEDIQAFTAFYEKEDHLTKLIDALLRCNDPYDRDVVIFAILLHDIGKLLEYTHHGDSEEKYNLWFPTSDIPMSTKQFGVSMDPLGMSIGHITLGVMFIYKYWLSGSYKELPHTFWLNVIGCIQSHHGRIDWNSTKVPSTSNEWLVHFCDYIDSKYANEK